MAFPVLFVIRDIWSLYQCNPESNIVFGVLDNGGEVETDTIQDEWQRCGYNHVILLRKSCDKLVYVIQRNGWHWETILKRKQTYIE